MDISFNHTLVKPIHLGEKFEVLSFNIFLDFNNGTKFSFHITYPDLDNLTSYNDLNDIINKPSRNDCDVFDYKSDSIIFNNVENSVKFMIESVSGNLYSYVIKGRKNYKKVKSIFRRILTLMKSYNENYTDTLIINDDNIELVSYDKYNKWFDIDVIYTHTNELDICECMDWINSTEKEYKQYKRINDNQLSINGSNIDITQFKSMLNKLYKLKYNKSLDFMESSDIDDIGLVHAVNLNWLQCQ